MSAVITSINGTNLVVTNSGVPVVAYTSTYRNYNGLVLEHIDAPINNFFTNGKLVITGTSKYRMIIAHTHISGTVDDVRLQFPINDLEVGDNVTLLPGCSKTYDSNEFECCNFCKSFRIPDDDEIDTINHYLGMPTIPYKNPTITPVQGS
jgi:hypothetical protein